MIKVFILIDNGFEEVEALTVVDYLRRTEDIQVDLVSANNQEYVIGSHQIRVGTDKILKDIKNEDYDAIVIPGGMPGATNLRDNPQVIELIKTMDKEKKYIAAICAGPIVLEKAEILKDRKVTSYPGFEDTFKDSEYVKDSVVIDDHIITARGPYYAVDFALTIIELLTNKKEKIKIEKDLLKPITSGYDFRKIKATSEKFRKERHRNHSFLERFKDFAQSKEKNNDGKLVAVKSGKAESYANYLVRVAILINEKDQSAYLMNEEIFKEKVIDLQNDIGFNKYNISESRFPNAAINTYLNFFAENYNKIGEI